MPMYTVTIPCTMAVCVTVEADDESAAKDAAMDVEWSINLETNNKAAAPEIVAMETHRRIVRGNVCAAVQNEIDVQEA